MNYIILSIVVLTNCAIYDLLKYLVSMGYTAYRVRKFNKLLDEINRKYYPEIFYGGTSD